MGPLLPATVRSYNIATPRPIPADLKQVLRLPKIVGVGILPHCHSDTESRPVLCLIASLLKARLEVDSAVWGRITGCILSIECRSHTLQSKREVPRPELDIDIHKCQEFRAGAFSIAVETDVWS